MNLEIIIPAVAAFFGIASLIAAGYSLKHYRNLLFFTEINSDQIDEIEKKLYRQNQIIEQMQDLVAEQACLIARLEAQAAPGRTPSGANRRPDRNRPAKPTGPNIRERRRQVLTLAGRGQDAETIAATLGMLPGEVELIVNLNHGAANFV